MPRLNDEDKLLPVAEPDDYKDAVDGFTSLAAAGLPPRIFEAVRALRARKIIRTLAGVSSHAPGAPS